MGNDFSSGSREVTRFNFSQYLSSALLEMGKCEEKNSYWKEIEESEKKIIARPEG